MTSSTQARTAELGPVASVRAETLSMPGDKSLSHRAIMFGSLARGTSSYTNMLAGEDCVCTRRAFEAMGVRITSPDPTRVTIEGAGFDGLRQPPADLYMGNSGTSMRLLLGILAGQPFTATLTGDPSLSSRPMRRVTAYLRQMGAVIDGRDDANYAPLTITGGALKGMDFKLNVSSAQVKSALLLAGLRASGTTSVAEPVLSRDHTERFLRHYGARVDVEGLAVRVTGGQSLMARSFEIAGDISSAAFFIAIGCLVPQADIRLRNVLWNPTRTGIIDVLRRSGADLTVERTAESGPEPVADLRVRPGRLRAFVVERQELPALIDEVPILSVLATQAEGVSVFRDADELRVKETDRIRSMIELLTRMGAKAWAEGNSLFVEGPCQLSGADLESYGDHRTAMSGIVAALIAKGRTRMRDIDCINTSFPSFFELLGQLGIPYEIG
ncbi:MAG: 3-phosphoshikimate 1-carboxyvinyltransferase 1 [Candidatus Omnitrophica bacterium]|nr:3-phosphoshikimate 1-carboxyvinyltransferase 1 [Candidatus Omnitrophota bacterium]